MPNPEIQAFENLDELSRAAEKLFERRAAEYATAGRNFSVALSGGSTPRRLYELMAEARARVAWDRVHFFQVDERSVPPDDAESNYGMIRQALLDRVPLPEENFHRIAAEREDRDGAAREYAAVLDRVLRPPAGEWPRLDLVFLGMGADGHTASLFPASPGLQEQKLWVRPNYSPALGELRMTLTFPVLNAARQVIFLVSGEDKAETLRQVLEGPREKFPAQGIHPVEGRLSWFVDKAAARLLTRPARIAS